MNGDDCLVCNKPILDEPGPVVMDREGKRYHFRCWSRLFDIRTQETRDHVEKMRNAIARGRESIARSRDATAKKRDRVTGPKPDQPSPPEDRPTS